MEKTFQTGSFSFRLRFPEELVLPADMEKFAVEKESADYTYTITIVDTLPEAEGELLVNRVDLQVFRNGEGLESRLIGVKGEERPYALYRETAQNHAQVFNLAIQKIVDEIFFRNHERSSDFQAANSMLMDSSNDGSLAFETE